MVKPHTAPITPPAPAVVPDYVVNVKSVEIVTDGWTAMAMGTAVGDFGASYVWSMTVWHHSTRYANIFDASSGRLLYSHGVASRKDAPVGLIDAIDDAVHKAAF